MPRRSMDVMHAAARLLANADGTAMLCIMCMQGALMRQTFSSSECCSTALQCPQESSAHEEGTEVPCLAGCMALVFG